MHRGLLLHNIDFEIAFIITALYLMHRSLLLHNIDFEIAFIMKSETLMFSQGKS